MRCIIPILTLALLSCQTTSTIRNIENISIQEIPMDGTSVRAIQAIDENEIYFAGSNGQVGYTTDSGATWTKQTITHDTLPVHFRSIAMNKSDLFVLSIANPALLYKIEDDKLTLVYSEEHENVFYDSMKFFEDGKHGIAVGDQTENCSSILLTNNGGETWQKIPCSQLPSFEEGEAFFAASNTNIAIQNETVWIATGGNKARVMKSIDYGLTWTIYDTPITQGGESQGIYSIDFYDELNGIVIGGDYSKPDENTANKAVTTDGGETWTIVADGNEPNYKSCVQYVPNGKGKEIIAVGKTGVSFSNDAGKTWKKVSDEAYYTIQFVDEHIAWLGGNEKIGRLNLNSGFN